MGLCDGIRLSNRQGRIYFALQLDDCQWAWRCASWLGNRWWINCHFGFSYGYAIKALPVTGGSVVFAMVSLGRTHSFIAGWALTLGNAGIVALNASAVTLVFRVTLPNLFQRFPLYDVAGWTI